MKRLFLIFLVSLFAISLNANEIGGDLQDMLLKAGDEDYISVVVHLKDQVDTRMLSEDLRGVGNTRAEIHKQVIDTLTDRAASTQVELKDILARHQLKSDVERYTSFWIFNGFTVTAKKAVIYEIASRDDVELVRAELKFFIPENEFANQPVRGVRAEVKDYGVKLINADDMWAEGYDGTGLIIANMDTGVNYYHKDLKDKWLGNSKPNSQCWFDPWEGSTIPKDGGVDTWQHGSHTMGSIVGEDVSGGIKYGVAPGAKWIAVRMFNTSGSASEENTIKCFQWLADPDGNSSTSDDVPDILNNSWGATTAYGGGVCDSSYYTYIDNCEAAGCVLFFSAGNSGPGSKTIGSPASRITSAINAFAVGAVDSANSIADFSSRGPSTCGTGTTIKPEVSAPGVQVWSVAGDGNTGYKYGDGTSMACPHVAGAAALLLQAKPSASVNDIKNALYNTAVYGPGQREEDNNYGKGVIDVYAAYHLLGGSATPDITYYSNYIDDSGDHYAAPGETFYFRVTLKNNGGGATGVSATLSESDSYVTLNDSYATFSDIGHNATGTCNSPYYRVAINAGCPAGHTVNFTLNVSADGSYSKSVGFSIVVGIPSENTFTSSDTPKVIPDNSASGVNSSQDLSNVGAISEVNVYCDITHTYIGDLIVKVISPEGTEATLHNKGGGSADNIVTWYNTNTLEAGPGKLDDFIGENGSGIWKLFVSDNAGQDTGQINSWKLEITSYGQPSDAVPPADISDLSASTGEAIGAVNLSWTAPGDDGASDTATRYIIKYNTVNITDGNWTSSSALSNLPAPKIGGSSESLTITGLTEGQLYYFAIKTEDKVPNSSGLSNVSSATAKAASAILLVDDDNGATSESYYKTALTNGGFTYDYWNVKNSGSPASSKLSQYQTVIWFTAADYQTTLTSTDENNLISYLNSGGHLLFVSHDYLYQLTGGTNGNITQNFAHNYLKVNSVTNDIGDSYETSANGVAGDPISNALNLTLSGTSPITNYADSITTSDGVTIFKNSKPEPCGIRYDNGTYRTVFLVFPFINISSSASRDTLITKVIDWLDNGGGASDTTAPATISNLNAVAGAQAGVIDLTWTAPGDDGTSGTAAAYEIKYNTVNITSSNWTSSNNISNPSAPKSAGSGEAISISGFTAGTLYYFAIKTKDEVPNTSGISNVASATPPGTTNELNYTSSDTPKNIPDNNTSGVESIINVSENYTIASVRVYTDIKHTYRGDLLVKVTSPAGTPVTLNNRGGGSADNLIGWFPDALTASGPGALSDFVGQSSNGAWKLHVDDNYAQDTGRIDSWKLEITYNGGGATDEVPPAKITDLAITKLSATSIKLTWTAPGDDGSEGDAAAYIIKCMTAAIYESNWSSASDITGEPAPAASGTQEALTISGLTSGNTYYFAIRTEDEIPNLSDVSNNAWLYLGEPPSDPTTILLVDDDGGSTNVETYYKNALDTNSYSYDNWVVSASGSPSAITLKNYNIVIWFIGGTYTNTLTATDETNLKSYLNSGGHLFFCGQDYLYEITGGTDGAVTGKDFCNNYLKISYVDNDVNDNSQTSRAGDPISNGLNLTLNASSPITNYSDDFDTTGEWFYKDSAGYASATRVENSTYKLVFMALPYENINSSATQAQLMDNIVQYLSAGPAAPTGLAVFNPNEDGTLNISWNSSPDTIVLGYKLYYELSDTTQFNVVANVSKTPKTSLSTMSRNTSSAALNVNSLSLLTEKSGSYRVLQSTDGSFYDEPPASPIDVGINTDLQINNLINSSKYKVWVTAYGSGNEGDRSSEESGTPTVSDNQFYFTCEIDDADATGGVKNGCLDPGEQNVKVIVTLINNGSAMAYNPTATLQKWNSADSNYSISGNSSAYADIASYGGTVICQTPYTVNVSTDCPVGHTISLQLNASGSNDYSTKFYFDTFVGQAQVLLVRDDDWDYLLTDGGKIKDALVDAGITFAEWDTVLYGSPNFTSGSSSNMNIAPYQAVVWFTGLGYDATLTNYDEENLRNYLNSGGNLFLSSQDYLWDRGQISSFAHNYLHIDSYYGDAQSNQQTGIADDPISDGMIFDLSYAFTDYSDDLIPLSDAQGILINNNGNYGGIRYPADGVPFDYRVVFFAFPFESIVDTGYVGCNKQDVMQRVLRWLTGFDYDSTVTSGDVVLFPEWSNDGQKIAYLYREVSGETNIRVTERLSGNSVANTIDITNALDDVSHVSQISWSYDDQYIIFGKRVGDFLRIAKVKYDGTQKGASELYQPTNALYLGSYTDPDYSDGVYQNDGKSRIVISACGDIWVYEPNNTSNADSGLKRITNLSDPLSTYAVVDKLYQPKWSEDGNKITFVDRWPDSSSYPGDGDIYTIDNVQNIISGGREPVSNWSDPDLYAVAVSTYPEWSPSFSLDGTMVSYNFDYNASFENVNFWTDPAGEFSSTDFDAYKRDSLGVGSADLLEAKSYNEGLIKWAPAGGDVFTYISRWSDGTYHLTTFNDSSIGGFTVKKFKAEEEFYTLCDNSRSSVTIPTYLFTEHDGDLRIVVPSYIPGCSSNLLPIGEYREFSIDGARPEIGEEMITVVIPFTAPAIRKIRDIQAIGLYFRNSAERKWEKVESEYTIDKKRNGNLTAAVDKLGIYGLFYDKNFKAKAIDDLSLITIVPNPFKPMDDDDDTGKTEGGIIFNNLPDNIKKITIYNISGEKISKWKESDEGNVIVYVKTTDAMDPATYVQQYYPTFITGINGGVARWIVKNDQYKDIASGIYFVVFEDADGNTKVKKAAVIK